MTEKQQKLIEILQEMFQLNQSDLDFGIYRIMNAKADEISSFLEKDLVGSIKEALSSGSNEEIKKELAKLEQTLIVKRGVKLGSFSPEILAKCNLKQQRFLFL